MSNVVIVESPAKAKTINKYLGSDYSIVQIIFVNSWFALIPIVLYTQTLNGWRKLKKANFTVHFFRALTMALALFFGYTGFYRLPMVTMYSIVFLIPLLISSLKKGITLPLDEITFPYLTTENLVCLSPTRLLAETNNLSEHNLVAPYKFMGAQALSVDSAIIFFTLF